MPVRLYACTALATITVVLAISGEQLPDYYNVPAEVQKYVDMDHLTITDKYTLSGDLNPFYLRGDFDGDGHMDYALLITTTDTRKRGIAIWMSSRPKARWQILGAGHLFQYGAGKSDNLDFDAWHVYGKQPVMQGSGEIAPPPRLRAEAILVEIKDSASGLIYWTGSSFAWYQQGD